MKKAVKSIFGALGLEVRKKGNFNNQSPPKEVKKTDEQGESFHRLQGVIPSPVEVIDVGAAIGKWSSRAMEFWPESKYTLFEPIQEYRERVAPFLEAHSNVKMVWAVAGNEEGMVTFSVTDDLYGSGVYGESAENTMQVPVKVIDNELQTETGPIFIKLDTHGFEKEVLSGAKEALKRAEGLIIEVYGFHVSPTAPLFHELSAHLWDAGFRLYDIIEVLRREKDNAFWQADAVFLRSSNKVFDSNTYR